MQSYCSKAAAEALETTHKGLVKSWLEAAAAPEAAGSWVWQVQGPGEQWNHYAEQNIMVPLLPRPRTEKDKVNMCSIAKRGNNAVANWSQQVLLILTIRYCHREGFFAIKTLTRRTLKFPLLFSGDRVYSVMNAVMPLITCLTVPLQTRTEKPLTCPAFNIDSRRAVSSSRISDALAARASAYKAKIVAGNDSLVRHGTKWTAHFSPHLL